MTRLPPPYPHQVVSDWMTANDVHVLTDSVEKTLLGVTWEKHPDRLDYDVSMRRARKMQADAIAAICRSIGKRIGRIVTNSLTALHDYWRTRQQIERLSHLTPRLLDDIGIPHEIQIRIQIRHAHRQLHCSHFYF